VDGGFVDDAEVDASACEVAGEGQAGGSRSYDEYGGLSRIVVGFEQWVPLRFILEGAGGEAVLPEPLDRAVVDVGEVDEVGLARRGWSEGRGWCGWSRVRGCGSWVLGAALDAKVTWGRYLIL
jgi:hypothetical protein